jgi:hypothetical protein
LSWLLPALSHDRESAERTKQKFFGSFFQKRTASFLHLIAVAEPEASWRKKPRP